VRLRVCRNLIPKERGRSISSRSDPSQREKVLPSLNRGNQLKWRRCPTPPLLILEVASLAGIDVRLPSSASSSPTAAAMGKSLRGQSAVAEVVRRRKTSEVCRRLTKVYDFDGVRRIADTFSPAGYRDAHSISVEQIRSAAILSTARFPFFAVLLPCLARRWHSWTLLARTLRWKDRTAVGKAARLAKL